MTPEAVREIAAEAAHQAVVETLNSLGFDLRDPQKIQQDQSFLRAMRVGTQNGIGTVVKAFLIATVTAFAGWLWVAFNRPH
jgi:hypothetical protein